MDIENYKNKIKDIDWGDFFEENDINILNNHFVEKVGAILGRMCPHEDHPDENFF